jgi:hypothetical protein
VLAAVAVFATAVLGTPSALADTEVKYDGSVLRIQSGLLQTNRITATLASNANVAIVTEGADGPRVDAGTGCVQADNRRASCPLNPGSAVRVELRASLGGNFTDEYDGSRLPLPQTVDGGVGIDDIVTGNADDQVTGGDNVDFIDTGPGVDRLQGESGPDFLTGGPGADTIDGGSKNDRARYREAAAPVTVDLRAHSGSVFGEAGQDVLVSVEDVEGGARADTLTGDSGPNELVGAGSGVLPNSGPPVSGSGPDTLTGLGGNDTIDAKRNRVRDTVSCGEGTDSAALDLADVTPADPSLVECESISFAAVDQHPTVSIATRRARVRGRGLAVPLRCSRRVRRGCGGRLTVRRQGGPNLAPPGRYRIRRGRGDTVRLGLNRRARRLIARPGRLPVEAVATERDSRGRPKISLARFTLRGS